MFDSSFLYGVVSASVLFGLGYAIANFDKIKSKFVRKKEYSISPFIDAKKDDLNVIGRRLIKNYTTGRNTFKCDDKIKSICDECSKFYNRNMRIDVTIFRRYNEFSVSYTFYAIGLRTFSIGTSSEKIIVTDESILRKLPDNGDAGFHHQVLKYSSTCC